MGSDKSILTTTVGSYPIPEWLGAARGEQSIRDAIRVIVDTQRQVGIDLPTDGELYRYDANHPETNGMIDYFVGPLEGVRSELGYRECETYFEQEGLSYRVKPAGVVESELGEGSLNLVAACERTKSVVGKDIKFTVTSPYMLGRMLLDKHYGDFEALVMAIAEILAHQVKALGCRCVQVDEANVTGHWKDGPLAAKAINKVLDAVQSEKAVHLCFGNYGGQTIQRGEWNQLIDFLNSLRCDHLVLEVAHRPANDLEALKGIRPDIALGIGVIDVKVNEIETAEEVANRIAKAEEVLGAGRVRWVHPDCGLWMLKRSVADAKLEALVKGRDRYMAMRDGNKLESR